MSPNRSVGRYPIALLACFVVAIAGCRPNPEEPATSVAVEPGLPIVSGSQLNEYLHASESPVLVEFGVDFNCPRCAQTKSDVVRLRETLEGDVDVVRVDFNSNAQKVVELGGTICPTYVLFDRGKHVLTRSYPVSIDLLEVEILQQIGQ